jgi:hypothetical protein
MARTAQMFTIQDMSQMQTEEADSTVLRIYIITKSQVKGRLRAGRGS